jgi:hypothetical protein
VSVRERDGLGRAGREAKAQEEWGRGAEAGQPKAKAQAAGPNSRNKTFSNFI